MEVEDELIQIANVTTPRIIKVIGVGGGGGNAVGQMYRDNIPEVRYLVANTDKKALDDNIVPDHLQLGPGLGAGGDPERGAALANECLDQINAALDDETKMVFITAGMGGGTGTGASPVIAHTAREKGILTVGIVTIPFLFEREKQIDKALDGLEKLSKEVDAMLVINNQRLCDIYGDLSIIKAFKCADETLSTAVSSITEIISMHGRVNLDFQDVNTTLRNGGVAVMSTGYAEGENRVTRAINDALNSPLLNNNDVFDASHILIAITTSSDDGATLRTGEVDEINAFMGHFNSDIETKWGLALTRSWGRLSKLLLLPRALDCMARRNASGTTNWRLTLTMLISWGAVGFTMAHRHGCADAPAATYLTMMTSTTRRCSNRWRRCLPSSARLNACRASANSRTGRPLTRR